MNHDKIIINSIYTKNGYLKSKFIKGANTKYTNITNYLNNRYEDSESRAETLCRIRYNIEEKPRCAYCGKPLKFRNYNKGNIDFGIYCSLKCKANSNEVKEKIKETSLNRYGVINGGGSKKSLEKIKNTCLEKYGCHPSQLESTKEKCRNTCKEKYGVEFNCNLPYVKRLAHTEEANKKRELTKDRNHSWTTSKPEEDLYLYIKEKFPDVKRQYKDKSRYPWHCDFYIPSLDYFIELNGNWTHGKHPYNKNDKEDIKLVNLWKEKYNNGNHKYYLIAIKCWTCYDVNKRNKAKESSLNYKEIWKLNEGKQFIDKLYNNGKVFDKT